MTPDSVGDAFVDSFEPAPFVVEPEIVDPEVVPDTDVSPAPAKAPGGVIQLFDATHGEIVEIVDAPRLLEAAGITDLTTTSMDTLAAFQLGGDDFRRILGEAQGIIGDQIIALLDLDHKWTKHLSAAVVNAPSPDAGTTEYVTDLLVDACSRLVAERVISQDAMDAAVEAVRPTLSVEFSLLHQVTAALAGDLTPAAREVLDRDLAGKLANEPKPAYRQRRAGIVALRKGADPGTLAALDACQAAVTPPKRKATVKPVRKD